MSDAQRREEPDVAVVGGGVVGASIAWGLARKGTRVAVLDEGDTAFRASRGNFALVWVQSKGLGMAEYAAWTKRSAEAGRGSLPSSSRKPGSTSPINSPADSCSAFRMPRCRRASTPRSGSTTSPTW